MRALLIAVVVLLASCRARVPEGQLNCKSPSECPGGWLCLDDDGAGKHCYSSKDAQKVGPGGSVAADAGKDGNAAKDAGNGGGKPTSDGGASGAVDSGIGLAVDAGRGTPEAATFTLGDLCYENAELGCDGFNSALTLVCSGGEWKEAGSCSGTQRCDTRLGEGQGQCLNILSECVGKDPGAEHCDGNNRQACGPDRLTLIASPCPEGNTCDLMGDTATCVLDLDECAMNSDTCDSDPDACKNTLGTYACECPDGFRGDGQGESGCEDIDECAANNGDCGDASIWKCSNNIGAPPTCEDTSLCGTNNGGCSTSPPAKCTEIAGAKASCECPAGYTGDGVGPNGCVDIDECTPGAVAVCGTGAVGCTNTPGSYSCSCTKTYYEGNGTTACRDVNECAGRVNPCALGTCVNHEGSVYTCCTMKLCL